MADQSPSPSVAERIATLDAERTRNADLRRAFRVMEHSAFVRFKAFVDSVAGSRAAERTE